MIIIGFFIVIFIIFLEDIKVVEKSFSKICKKKKNICINDTIG